MVTEKNKSKQIAPLAPQKVLYTVRLEVMAPVELTYRVWAESPEKALESIKNSPFAGPPKPILSRKKNIKATVYKYGTTIVEFVKNFI